MLHIVSNPNSLDTCLSHLVDDDAVILIGNGVYGVSHNSVNSRIPVYALETDLTARGIPAATNVTPTDISQFVTLVVQHPNSVTWT